MNVTEMRQGQTYRVSGFSGNQNDYAEKLYKMGFVIGTAIELAPVKISDPLVFQIRGSRIALRKKEALDILVEE